MFFPIIILIIHFSANINNSQAENIIASPIIFGDDFTITSLELEKQYRETFNGGQSDSMTIKSWTNRFIGRAFLLADAYVLGYDKHPETKNTIKAVDKTIITQRNKYGVIYKNEILKKIAITEQEIKETWHKASVNYFFDLIIIRDIDSYNKYAKRYSNFDCISSFQLCCKECKENEDICIESKYGNWPFMYFWEINEELYMQKPNTVSLPLRTEKGIVITYLKDKKIIPERDYRKDKEKITSQIKRLKQFKLEKAFYTTVKDDSHIEYNDDNISQLHKIITTEGLTNQIDPKAFSEITDIVLLYYFSDNQLHSFTIGNFIKEYNQAVFKPSINKNSDLRECLTDLVINKTLYETGMHQNILNNEEIRHEREAFIHKTILETYIKHEISKNITITESEISEYYKENTLLFIESSTANIQEIRFADTNTYEIWEKHFKKTEKLDFNSKNANIASSNLTIQRDCKTYPRTIIESIFSSDNNKPLGPFNKNGQIILIIKNNEEGLHTISIEDAQNSIKNTLFNKKKAAAEKKRIEKLKDKYVLEYNITHILLLVDNMAARHNCNPIHQSGGTKNEQSTDSHHDGCCSRIFR